ncbi:hypothetical protein GWK47_005936 [Chionoecetes opilio]|uniref:Uncharacterized protein n=1 Tax=Chionoecetes opilio TaxID=41210 RepID=A0A8J4Y7G8_CHIOP|nr:hypothetical protein GWK47_005936 [Chionoecetes opilio]
MNIALLEDPKKEELGVGSFVLGKGDGATVTPVARKSNGGPPTMTPPWRHAWNTLMGKGLSRDGCCGSTENGTAAGPDLQHHPVYTSLGPKLHLGGFEFGSWYATVAGA